MAYSEAVADEICTRLMSGQSLRAICRDPEMPGFQTVLDWLNRDDCEDFRAKYARARVVQAEVMVDEMQEIADDGRNDWMETEAGPRLNPESVQRSKVRLEQRRWFAEKLLPKKYGAQLTLAGDPTRPLVTRIEREVIDPANPDPAQIRPAT